MENRANLVVAVLIAAILTVAIVGSMIIIDEADSNFKAFLNGLTGHHWVTKSVFTVILFPVFAVLFYGLFKFKSVRGTLRAENVWGWTILLVAVTVFFYLASLVNYLIHYFLI